MKKENSEKIKCLESYEGDEYEREIHCKCTLETFNNGKSWVIGKVFYVSVPHKGKFGKGKFIEEAELEGLSLITE